MSGQKRESAVGGVLCWCGVGWCALRGMGVCRKARMVGVGWSAWHPTALSLLSQSPVSPTTLSLLSQPPVSPAALSLLSQPPVSPHRAFPPVSPATLSLQSFSPLSLSSLAHSAPPQPLHFKVFLARVRPTLLSLNILPKCPAFRAMQDIYLTDCGSGFYVLS